MADVFISHATADREQADAILAACEAQGLSCWIAPRDIFAGTSWADAIVRGIAEATVILLVHSEAANASPMVLREIDAAAAARKTILPVRIDAAMPKQGLAFYLSATHWFDAPAPLAMHLPRLVETIGRLLHPAATSPIPPFPEHGGRPTADSSFAERPAVAVLAFRDYGPATPDHLADSLTEDLIAAVSAWRIFPVIASGTVFALRDSTTDLRVLGGLLNARYLISGSIRRQKDRVRVTVELADAETADVLLSRRFDGAANDTLQLLDEIVPAIGGLLSPELWKQERERAVTRARDNPTAHELVMRGLSQRHGGTPEALAAAEALFNEALAIDPGDANALAALSISRNFAAIRRWTDDVPGTFQASFDLARRAVAADPLNSQCHFAVGIGLMNLGRREEAITSLREAIRLNPSFAAARANLGQLYNYLNRPDEALPELELALRLSPQDPYRYQSLPYLAASHYLSGNYATALASSEAALALAPDYPLATRYRIAALGQLGRVEEARALFPTLRRTDPDFVALEALTRRLFVPPAADHILDGFRKAGFA